VDVGESVSDRAPGGRLVHGDYLRRRLSGSTFLLGSSEVTAGEGHHKGKEGQKNSTDSSRTQRHRCESRIVNVDN
jgi:hypothetical protein